MSITVTGTWADWEFEGRDPIFKEKVIHPTPGRDRPLVVECSSPFTATVMAGVLKRLGCDVEEATKWKRS